MEIQKLIEIFKLLLPIYEKGYNENYKFVNLINHHLYKGICNASYEQLDYSLFWPFSSSGYYRNYIKKYNGYIFPKPKTGKDLKSRINFMKSEIKSLNKLLKEGYTHV